MGSFIRAGAFTGFVGLVNELGEDPIAILNSVGINKSQLENADNAIPSTASVMALRIAAEKTKCPEFGLRLGWRQNLSALGPIALLALQCDTLDEAIKTTQRFIHLHNACAIVNLQTLKNHTLLCYDDATPELPRDPQNCLLALALGIHFFRHFNGPAWAAESIHFVHSEPEDCRFYKQVFNAPLFFDQDTYAIECKTSNLHKKIQLADPEIKQKITHHLLNLERHQSENIRLITTKLIHSMLITGQCTEKNIADIIGINRRTLQRKLKTEGVSFNRLLAKIRIDLAKQYLHDSKISFTELSTVLGYSELSSFTRFFRTHFNMSPTQYMERSITKGN